MRNSFESLIRVTARWLRSALFPLVLLATGADAGGSPPALLPGNVDGPETGTIATVNGEEISLSRFNALWAASRKNLVLVDGRVPEPIAQAQKAQIAEQLIEELLIERAAEQEQLVVEEREVDEALDVMRRRFPSPEAFNEHVATRSRGLAELRQQWRVERLLERLMERRATKALPEEVLRQTYERHESHFRAPGFLVVEELLLRVTPTMPDEESQAMRVRAQYLREQALVPGVEFAALQRTSSEAHRPPGPGTTRLTATSAPGEVWSALVDLEPQSVSPVVQTQQGFHVFKLVERGPVVRQSFEVMKGRVAAELEQMLRGASRMEFQKELRARSLIKNELAERLSKRLGVPAR
ncbi:peptidylprolyl isomerase [Myxococcus sp. Y35]|uniref:peptidylprolyl isomerase n=1 Tax=Pseudomyxococcus flavus TaxID=3115648 RepID=UPI003CE874AF